MLPILKSKNYQIIDSKDNIMIKMVNHEFAGHNILLDNVEINHLYKWLTERKKILDGFVLVKISPATKEELVFVSESTSKIIGKDEYNIRKLIEILKSRNLSYDDLVEIFVKYGDVNLSTY